jgi:hypothetical protein
MSVPVVPGGRVRPRRHQAGPSARLLPSPGRWMNANDRWIQVVLGLGFGIWLLVKGINGL